MIPPIVSAAAQSSSAAAARCRYSAPSRRLIGSSERVASSQELGPWIQQFVARRRVVGVILVVVIFVAVQLVVVI